MIETNLKLPMKVVEVNNTSSKLVLEINKEKLIGFVQVVFAVLFFISFITAITISYLTASPMLVPLLKVGGIIFLIGLIAFLSKLK